MKNINFRQELNTMYRLLIFAFVLSACASGKLRYVPMNEHVELHEENVKKDRIERLLEDSVDQMVSAQAVEQTYVDPIEEVREDRKDDLAQRVLKQLEQEDPDSYRKMNALYERATHHNAGKAYAQNENEAEAGRVLLIIALILAIISLLFIMRANTVSTADSSAEGCATALANMVIFTIFAIIFGIAAVVLLVVGLIVVAANSETRKS